MTMFMATCYISILKAYIVKLIIILWQQILPRKEKNKIKKC